MQIYQVNNKLQQEQRFNLNLNCTSHQAKTTAQLIKVNLTKLNKHRQMRTKQVIREKQKQTHSAMTLSFNKPKQQAHINNANVPNNNQRVCTYISNPQNQSAQYNHINAYLSAREGQNNQKLANLLSLSQININYHPNAKDQSQFYSVINSKINKEKEKQRQRYLNEANMPEGESSPLKPVLGGGAATKPSKTKRSKSNKKNILSCQQILNIAKKRDTCSAMSSFQTSKNNTIANSQIHNGLGSSKSKKKNKKQLNNNSYANFQHINISNNANISKIYNTIKLQCNNNSQKVKHANNKYYEHKSFNNSKGIPKNEQNQSNFAVNYPLSMSHSYIVFSEKDSTMNNTTNILKNISMKNSVKHSSTASIKNKEQKQLKISDKLNKIRVEHCAIIIQKHWRGYLTRKLLQDYIKNEEKKLVNRLNNIRMQKLEYEKFKRLSPGCNKVWDVQNLDENIADIDLSGILQKQFQFEFQVSAHKKKTEVFENEQAISKRSGCHSSKFQQESWSQNKEKKEVQDMDKNSQIYSQYEYHKKSPIRIPNANPLINLFGQSPNDSNIELIKKTDNQHISSGDSGLKKELGDGRIQNIDQGNIVQNNQNDSHFTKISHRIQPRNEKVILQTQYSSTNRNSNVHLNKDSGSNYQSINKMVRDSIEDHRQALQIPDYNQMDSGQTGKILRCTKQFQYHIVPYPKDCPVRIDGCNRYGSKQRIERTMGEIVDRIKQVLSPAIQKQQKNITQRIKQQAIDFSYLLKYKQKVRHLYNAIQTQANHFSTAIQSLLVNIIHEADSDHDLNSIQQERGGDKQGIDLPLKINQIRLNNKGGVMDINSSNRESKLISRQIYKKLSQITSNIQSINDGNKSNSQAHSPETNQETKADHSSVLSCINKNGQSRAKRNSTRGDMTGNNCQADGSMANSQSIRHRQQQSTLNDELLILPETLKPTNTSPISEYFTIQLPTEQLSPHKYTSEYEQPQLNSQPNTVMSLGLSNLRNYLYNLHHQYINIISHHNTQQLNQQEQSELETFKMPNMSLPSPTSSSQRTTTAKISQTSYLCGVLKKNSEIGPQNMMERCFIQMLVQILTGQFTLYDILSTIDDMVDAQSTNTNKDMKGHQQTAQEGEAQNDGIAYSEQHSQQISNKNEMIVKFIEKWADQLDKWELGPIQEVSCNMEQSAVITQKNQNHSQSRSSSYHHTISKQSSLQFKQFTINHN